jgi:hypothetical protein
MVRTKPIKKLINQKNYYFVANAFISQINTQTMRTHLSSQFHTAALRCFPFKHYTLAGFELGSSVPEADLISTSPCRQGKSKSILHVAALIVVAVNDADAVVGVVATVFAVVVAVILSLYLWLQCLKLNKLLALAPFH